MSQLIQIRNELERGDYRSLYIGWLLAIWTGLPDEDTTEPAVPPGLASPTAAQQSLIEFLQLDKDLVAAAAKASESLSPKTDGTEGMRAWIDQLQDDEMKQMLLRVLQGKSKYVQGELRRGYNQFLKESRASDTEDTGSPLRTAQQLFELAEEAGRQRQEREKLALRRQRAAEERKRRAYLAELIEQSPEIWKEIENLAEEKIASAYVRAVELLVDLSDAYDQAERSEEFRSVIFGFAARRKRQPALVRRMKEAELELPF